MQLMVRSASSAEGHSRPREVYSGQERSPPREVYSSPEGHSRQREVYSGQGRPVMRSQWTGAPWRHVRQVGRSTDT